MPGSGDEGEVVAEGGSVVGTTVNPSKDERQWQRRLKGFSGRRSPGPSELELWEYEVGQLTEEENMDDRVKWRLVMGSLLQPAVSLACSLGSTADVTKIVKV